jgi:hypothetical protein
VLCGNAEAETAGRVNKVYALLLGMPGGAVDLWRFVTNPASFGQSVENLFYVSFLVGEGRAAVEIGEDGRSLVLKAAKAPQKGDLDKGVAKRKQCVLHINWHTWERNANKFRAEGAIIPHRESVGDFAALASTTPPPAVPPSTTIPPRRRRQREREADAEEEEAPTIKMRRPAPAIDDEDP